MSENDAVEEEDKPPSEMADGLSQFHTSRMGDDFYFSYQCVLRHLRSFIVRRQPIHCGFSVVGVRGISDSLVSGYLDQVS